MAPADLAATAPLVLLVDDEPQMRRFLRATLPSRGFRLVEAASGEEALSEAAARRPDLVLLDLGLPDMDGQKVIEGLREWSRVPVLVLSVRGSEPDKVQAFNAGADDYLTKPFGIDELLARMHVALRHARVQDGGSSEPTFEVGHLRVDLAARRVLVKDAPVHLTRTEYQLLAMLVRHAGKVVTHPQLLAEVWGPEAVHQTGNLRVYMKQLRHKLEEEPACPRYLLTETGVGYRLAVD
jgi:two-component system KDP operon response regulator KdpE